MLDIIPMSGRITDNRIRPTIRERIMTSPTALAGRKTEYDSKAAYRAEPKEPKKPAYKGARKAISCADSRNRTND